ncbi:hypothetical protein GCM10009647_012370 [Streptomyces sanglieri]
MARLPEGPPDGGAGSAAQGPEAAGGAGGGTAVEGCVIGGSSGANGRLGAGSDACSRHGSAEKDQFRGGPTGRGAQAIWYTEYQARGYGRFPGSAMIAAREPEETGSDGQEASP